MSKKTKEIVEFMKKSKRKNKKICPFVGKICLKSKCICWDSECECCGFLDNIRVVHKLDDISDNLETLIYD